MNSQDLSSHSVAASPEHAAAQTTEPRLYRVPALFWLDHADRAPCDSAEQMAEEITIQKRIAFIMANAVQLECLRSDAAFYAEGNCDDCKSITRSAKATLEAIARQVA